jgi:hypothetical protein
MPVLSGLGLFSIFTTVFILKMVDIRKPNRQCWGDPDPPDPHVYGPPGSGSISQRYGSGSICQRYGSSHLNVTDPQHRLPVPGTSSFSYSNVCSFFFCTVRLPCNFVATLHFVLADGLKISLFRLQCEKIYTSPCQSVPTSVSPATG